VADPHHTLRPGSKGVADPQGCGHVLYVLIKVLKTNNVVKTDLHGPCGRDLSERTCMNHVWQGRIRTDLHEPYGRD
jgi:hypothetical protein